MRRQRRITRGLKWPVSQICKSIICHERNEVRHRKRTIELVHVRFRQIEELEQQITKILRAIGLNFQPHRVAATGTPQLLFDCPQEIFRFLLVDVEIAVSRNAERMDAIQDKTGK